MNTRSKSPHTVHIVTDSGGDIIGPPELDVDVIASDNDDFQDSFTDMNEMHLHAAQGAKPKQKAAHSTTPSKSTVTVQRDFACERQKLLEELQAVEQQEELLRLRASVRASKDRIRSLQKDCNNNANPPSVPPQAPVLNQVTLKQLKADGNLTAAVDNNLAKVLGNMWADEEEQMVVPDKGKVKPVIKSGFDSKTNNRVQHETFWAHCFLQYEHVARELDFKDLSPYLLVAGELEVVLSGQLFEQEVTARLNFLKLLMYYANDRIPASALRDWYAAFLKAIEIGRDSCVNSG